MTEQSQFPTLYKKTSSGKIQMWKIFAVGNLIRTKWGQLGSDKIQVTNEIITSGKNIGQVNETTIEEQAIKDAQSYWERQLKKGYVDSIEKAESGTVSDLITGGIFPMLAHTYREHGDKIVFPAYMQPKFDGHRCLTKVCEEKTEMWSRTRKPIISAPHIKEVFKFAFLEHYLDGELYNHAYRKDFDELSSMIRQQKKPAENCTEIQYHIYDIAIPDKTFEQRLAIMNAMKAVIQSPYIVFAETILVNNEEEMMAAFRHFIDLGYEGGIVRNAAGLYVNKRSYDLQKVKEFDDAEFECVGVDSGKGKMSDKATFVCKTNKGAEFTCKMKGDMEELKKFLIDPFLVIGKMITVQYQGLTGKNKVPRFPVALRIREEE